MSDLSNTKDSQPAFPGAGGSLPSLLIASFVGDPRDDGDYRLHISGAELSTLWSACERVEKDAAEYKRLYEQEQGEKRTILEAAAFLARGANTQCSQLGNKPSNPDDASR